MSNANFVAWRSKVAILAQLFGPYIAARPVNRDKQFVAGVTAGNPLLGCFTGVLLNDLK